MHRFSITAILFAIALGFVASPVAVSAQSLEELNVQLHGFATQSLTYTTRNNWNTMDTSDGSAAWTEVVVNLSAEPTSKLTFGVQARYFLLGTMGNSISLDWANADLKLNDRFGIRVGKVKSPAGMLNMTQDIDPAHLWILLPQSIYAIGSRSSLLAHYGGVAYGRVALGESGGKLNYYGYGGLGYGYGWGPQQVSYESIPAGEVTVRRGDPVHATNGDIGKVAGLVIGTPAGQVTHVLLQEGHLWDKKDVAIPIRSITRVGDMVQVAMTKHEIGELPTVDIDHPELQARKP